MSSIHTAVKLSICLFMFSLSSTYSRKISIWPLVQSEHLMKYRCSHIHSSDKMWYNQNHFLIKFNCYENKILHTRKAVIGQNKVIEIFDKQLSIMGTQGRITCKEGVKSSMQKRICFIQTCKVFLSNSNGLYL